MTGKFELCDNIWHIWRHKIVAVVRAICHLSYHLSTAKSLPSSGENLPNQHHLWKNMKATEKKTLLTENILIHFSQQYQKKCQDWNSSPKIFNLLLYHWATPAMLYFRRKEYHNPIPKVTSEVSKSASTDQNYHHTFSFHE